MRVIYKYALEVGVQKIVVPAGSKPLHVHEQDGRLMVWVEQDLDANGYECLNTAVVGTGMPVTHEFLEYVEYLGTAHVAGEVWHVYYNISPSN